MNRPPEIPEDIWSVLTVRVAGAARLLPPSCDSDEWEGKLVKDTFEDESEPARLLVLRCADEGGKFSKGMRCTMEKSLAKVHMQSVQDNHIVCAVVDNRTVIFAMPINNPEDIREIGQSGAMRRVVGYSVLTFDLAVRRGVDAAVIVYGLILFALAVRRELQQREADRLLADTDAAMDAVMATARELAESEARR